MAKTSAIGLAMVISALALSGCEEGQMPSFLQGSGGGGTATANTSGRTVERDVEAPEIFQVTDNGLWDGRPSLGGVWVAHEDAQDPERVIIRNEANGKFVVGVLYRPERQSPGPKIQVSSDAADALGMLAGQPARLNITALKREEVAVDAPAPAAESPETLAAAPSVQASSLDDPIAAATAALDAAEGKPVAGVATAATASAAAVATAPVASAPAPAAAGLSKPYIQIGIFSVQKNAENTAEALRTAGMLPTVKPGKMNGKDFWRVIVGPATSSAERTTLLKKIKDLGFNDAYFVTN